MVRQERFPGVELHYTEEEELAAQAVLERWASSHLNDKIKLKDYDPDAHPYQKLEIVHMDPRPDLDLACQMGAISIGEAVYKRLLGDLQRFGLIEEIRQLANRPHPQSSMMITPHFRDIMDAPVGHNASFVASGDESFAYKNVIVANHMVKRLEIFGVGVPEVIAAAGHIVFGHPEKSKDYGMSETVTQSGNRALAPLLAKFIKDGALVHIAPTETRAKKIILAGGQQAKMLPRVDDSLARMAKNRISLIMALPMDIRPGQADFELIGPLVPQQINDVHYLMDRSADSLSRMSGEPVVYGLPEGAQIASDQ